MENSIDLYQVTEVELVYRSIVKPSLRPSVGSSSEAHKILFKNWNSDKLELIEQFKVLLLNTYNKVLGIFEVSTGGVTGTIADPKIIFSSALKANATGIILAHNHPSGNLQPSTADINLTKKIVGAGELLDIKVLDHLIITSESYYSFRDQGLF
jgi:DNA repair protein RadC